MPVEAKSSGAAKSAISRAIDIVITDEMSDVLKECRHCDVHRIGPSCPNGFAAKPSRTVPAKSGGPISV